MVHWIANAYAKKGITVNGIAPALIQDTKMLPGNNEELSKSECYGNYSDRNADASRNSDRSPRYSKRDRRHSSLDGQQRLRDQQDHCRGWRNVSPMRAMMRSSKRDRGAMIKCLVESG